MYLLAMMSSQKLASLHPEEVSSGYRLAKKSKIQCGGTSLVPIVLVLLSCFLVFCTLFWRPVLQFLTCNYALEKWAGQNRKAVVRQMRLVCLIYFTWLPAYQSPSPLVCLIYFTSLPTRLPVFQSSLFCSNTLPLDTSLLIHKFSLYILEAF